MTDPTVKDLVDRWVEQENRGELPTLEAICAECPHLKEPLRLALEERTRATLDPNQPPSHQDKDWDLPTIPDGAHNAKPKPKNASMDETVDLPSANLTPPLNETLNEPPQPSEDTSATPPLSETIDAPPTESALPSNPTVTESPEHKTKSDMTSGGPSSANIEIPGYKILEELGRGGMGVVYKAMQIDAERIVGIKMMLAGEQATENDRERFRTEAKSAATLNHPNVVQVFEVGEVHGNPFFSMEFCSGGTLEDQLGTTTMSPRDSAQLMHTLSKAMQFAHEHRIIHRDLKPANILLKGQKIPKIMDFGLAKRIDEMGQTISGSIMGSPSYMSPEQAQGKTEEIGPLSDVYSLGAVLYVCLTGRPPFKAPSLIQTLKQVVEQDPVSPRRLNQEVDRDLETICLKCLQKSPQKRYASAGALAADLQRFLEGKPIEARPICFVEKAWRWALLNKALAGFGLAIFALLLLAPVVVWLFGRLEVADEQQRVAQEKQRVAQEKQKAADARTQTEIALRQAADERALSDRKLARAREYFALLHRAREHKSHHRPGWRTNSLADLQTAAKLDVQDKALPELRSDAASYLGGIDLVENRVLAKAFPTLAMAFSSDGRWLAVGRFKSQAWILPCPILLVDVTGKEPQRTLQATPSLVIDKGKPVQDGVRALVFSPDGKQLAVGMRSNNIYLYDLAKPDKPRSWKSPGDPVGALLYAKDGSALFSYAGGETNVLIRWSLSELGKREAELQGALGSPTLSPDGKTLLVDHQGRTTIRDVKTLEQIRIIASMSAGNHPAFAPDGRVVALSSSEVIQLHDVEADVPIHRLISPYLKRPHTGGVDLLEFTGDGSLVISASRSNSAPTVKLWERSTGRLLLTQSLGSKAPFLVAVSPQGRYVVTAGDGQIVFREIRGLEEQTFFGHHPFPLVRAQFSPDDQQLVATAERWLGAAKVGYFTLWDVASSQNTRWEQLEIHPHDWDEHSLLYHPSGKSFVATWAHTWIDRWDRNGERQFSIETTKPEGLFFERSGKVLWGIHQGNRLASWTWPEGKRTEHWRNIGSEALTGLGGLYDVARGDKWMLVAGRDGHVRLFANDKPTEPKSVLQGPGDPVLHVALAPDESVVAAGTQGGRIRIFAIPDGEVVADLDAHFGRVVSLMFNAEGTLLISASADRNVRFWVRRGSIFAPFLTLRSPSPLVHAALNSAGDKLALVGYNETSLRLWHLDRLFARLEEMGIPSRP